MARLPMFQLDFLTILLLHLALLRTRYICPITHHTIISENCVIEYRLSKSRVCVCDLSVLLSTDTLRVVCVI